MKGWYNSTVCQVCSWHAADAEVAGAAREIIDRARAARQTAVAWGTLTWLPENAGFHAALNTCVPWPTAMTWFRSHGFKEFKDWTLLGHMDGYDETRAQAALAPPSLGHPNSEPTRRAGQEDVERSVRGGGG